MTDIASYIRFWARTHPEKEFVRFGGRDLTWGELDLRSDALALGLHSIGMAKGDRLSVLMENRLEYVEIVAACMKLGVIVNPLNFRLTQSELEFQIRDAGSRVVVTETRLASALEGLDPAPPDFLKILSADGPDLASLADVPPDAKPPAVDIAPDDGLFLCYTSGTTGFPKAALLTHRSVREDALAKHLPDGVTSADRVLCLATLGVTGGAVSILTQLGFVLGCTIVMERDYSPERCLEIIESERISVMANVPVFLTLMAKHPRFATIDISSLRHITSGGSELTRELLAVYEEKGVHIAQGYGLTESSTWAASMTGRDTVDHLGTVGRPIMHHEIRIVGPDDAEMAVGEDGEILVRGPGVMREYWNNPSATSDALRGGWLHTGDVGHFDEFGYLTVSDRKKDMIRSGGLNVFPAEIERVLGGLSGLHDIAVIGIPHPQWGEVGLLVVGGAAEFDIEELKQACEKDLASYKHPHHVVIFDGPLPRNATGKLTKTKLRELYPELPKEAVALR